MAIVFVPFSALGEFIFSLLFGLYTYKFGAVPLLCPSAMPSCLAPAC